MTAKERSDDHGDGASEADRAKRRADANARTRRSEQALRAALRDGPVRRRAGHGDVEIREVVIASTDEGLDYLDVIAEPGASGEHHFRIFNPPTGVRRPDGSVEEDPVLALVEVLALHGGATQSTQTKPRRTP